MQHPLQNVWRIALWQRVSYQVFKAAFFLSIVSLIAEYRVPGFVSNWFNPLWFVVLALVSGCVATCQSNDSN